MHLKLLVGEKLANLANHELFAKFFLTYIHRYSENVFGICTALAYLPNFSLHTNSFYLYGLPKISPSKIFPCVQYLHYTHMSMVTGHANWS